MTLHFIKAVLGIACLMGTVLHALPIDMPKIPLVEDVTKLGDVPIVEDSEFTALWSDVTALSFTEERAADDSVDIDIGFYLAEHGDGTGETFDGIGGVLGVAFIPDEPALFPKDHLSLSVRGDVHFDDAEIWTINGKTGANPNIAPDLCQDASIDTITRTQDGSTYVFKGLWYWQIIDDKIADGYPRKIPEDWEGLEGYLDAAFTEPEGNTYFFKGRRYWTFINKKKNHDPNLISRGFQGIPDNLDAAFSLNEIGKTYLFKGAEYWRYDKTSYPPVNREYPKPITDFTGLPPKSIDAAFVVVDNPVYFFTGDRYYLYDEETSTVPDADPPYPRPTAPYLFSCPNAES